jgi:hypothetical protein
LSRSALVALAALVAFAALVADGTVPRVASFTFAPVRVFSPMSCPKIEPGTAFRPGAAALPLMSSPVSVPSVNFCFLPLAGCPLMSVPVSELSTTLALLIVEAA